MRKAFVLAFLLLSCTSPRQVSQAKPQAGEVATVATPHTWKIDDTFFYREDGSFLQYPRIIQDSSFCISNSWFGVDTFAEIMGDSGNVLKRYIMPPREYFRVHVLIK